VGFVGWMIIYSTRKIALLFFEKLPAGDAQARGEERSIIRHLRACSWNFALCAERR